MSQNQGFSDKIIRIYLLGASILLAFFLAAFHSGILLTENSVVERRIGIVAPYHFKRFEAGEGGAIQIDPLLTLYESHQLLPTHIQSKVSPDWTGSMQLLLDDEREFQVVAKTVMVQQTPRIVYAVEGADSVEWDDTGFVLIELTLALIGVALFLVTTAYMIKAAKGIARPFLQVANQLKSETANQFEPLTPAGEHTRELTQIVTAINAYRARLAIQIEREQSFTRYVSHELRTPMMVIKGTLSNLRRQTPRSHAQPLDKIAKATDQMQGLTQTFLMLARDQGLDKDVTCVDATWVAQFGNELADTIEANQVDFQWQLEAPFELNAHPQLLMAVIQNLLKNAFACSVEGKVSLMINRQGLDVIDDGLGLDAKPRGYEGFGIGLVLVNDVCRKYGWQFRLVNNDSQGCTATIRFNTSQ